MTPTNAIFNAKRCRHATVFAGLLVTVTMLSGSPRADDSAAGEPPGTPTGSTGVAGAAPRVVVAAPGDTLISIVERAGYAADLRLQALIAVYQANLQAFDGNAYRLLPGSTLRLPDEREVAMIDQHAARQQVRQQYDGYRHDGPRIEPATAAAPAAAPAQAAAQAAAPDLPADASPPVAAPAPPAEAPRRAARKPMPTMAQQDRSLQRALDATLAELTTRIASLTASMTDLTRAIAQTDDRIATLKSTLQDLAAAPVNTAPVNAVADILPAAAPAAGPTRGTDHKWSSIDKALIAAVMVLGGGLLAVFFWKLRGHPVARAPRPEPAAIA